MAPNVLPDRCLREGVQAQAIELAKSLQRRELLDAENRDDSIQNNPLRIPEMRSSRMKVWRLKHPMDISGYYTLSMHYYPVTGTASRGVSKQIGQIDASGGSGLGMALDVFPDRRLRKGVQAHPVARAESPNRREFLLPKDGDDSMQRTTARRAEHLAIDESIWLSPCQTVVAMGHYTSTII